MKLIPTFLFLVLTFASASSAEEGIVLAASLDDACTVLVATKDLKPLVFAVASKERGCELFADPKAPELVAVPDDGAVIHRRGFNAMVIQIEARPFIIKYFDALYGTAVVSFGGVQKIADLPWSVREGKSSGQDYTAMVARVRDASALVSGIATTCSAKTNNEWTAKLLEQMKQWSKNNMVYIPVVMP